MPTRPPPTTIPASPEEVEDRLRRQLLTVRSVWFPTRRELRDWDLTPAHLYIRWLAGSRFEVGPRLGSMWAACFSPVVRGTLSAGPDGTVLTLERSYPRFTTAVIAAWSVILTLWLASLWSEIASGHQAPGVLGFWFLLAGGALAALVVGNRMGGAALDEHLPSVLDVASNAPVDEDW